jgi:membrane protein implicated in regulation of membrane protease activity
VTGMRLGIASFVLLLAAAILLFWNVWAGLAAFIASILAQTMARKRFAREDVDMFRRERS